MPRTAFVLTMALILLGCGSSSDTQNDPWDMLQKRAVELPSLPPGGVCPVTTTKLINPDFAPAMGDGPVYLVLGRNGTSPYEDRDLRLDGIYWLKSLWVADPSYRDPTLIRGRQLDGQQDLLFTSYQQESVTSLEFPVETGMSASDSDRGWRFLTSQTGVRSAGCYGIQVDGLGFSETIIFRAIPAAP